MSRIKTILLVLALLGVAIGLQFRGDKERQKKPSTELVAQCNAGDHDACEKRCQKGDAQSCYNLATMYEKGTGAKVDLIRAAELYRKACKGGIQPACDILESPAELTVPPPPTLSMRCQHKDANACEELCGQGDKGACTLLGLLYRDGRGVTRDMAKATQLLDKACSEGGATACYDLAVLYDAGHGVEKDPKRAVQLYEKACTGSHAIGCRNLGVSYDLGQGVEIDTTRAREFFALACKLGDKTSCGAGQK